MCVQRPKCRTIDYLFSKHLHECQDLAFLAASSGITLVHNRLIETANLIFLDGQAFDLPCNVNPLPIRRPPSFTDRVSGHNNVFGISKDVDSDSIIIATVNDLVILKQITVGLKSFPRESSRKSTQPFRCS